MKPCKNHFKNTRVTYLENKPYWTLHTYCGKYSRKGTKC